MIQKNQNKDFLKKTNELIKSLYGIASSPDEALLLIDHLHVNPDLISSTWNNIQKEYIRHCVYCGNQYIVSKTNAAAEGFCPKCDSDTFRKELLRVQKQRRRAVRLNKLATLTFRQWIDTLNYFGWKCAYCRKEKLHDMEHFVPLRACGIDRGTTINNCVPACSYCNWAKRSRNPLIMRSLKSIRIAKSDIDRVKQYLANQR